jgi:hypothetical protein
MKVRRSDALQAVSVYQWNIAKRNSRCQANTRDDARLHELAVFFAETLSLNGLRAASRGKPEACGGIG